MAELWSSGIEITGNLTVAASVNSSFYYILTALRDDWPYSTSPGGLANQATYNILYQLEHFFIN